MKLSTLIYNDKKHYKFVNNNKLPQAIKCCFSYNLLMLGPLTMKLCTLMYFGGEDNDKESEAINTCYFLYGHCAPMHVHAVKKGKEKSK